LDISSDIKKPKIITMKKLLLSITVALFISVSAFAQIINNGFENWTSMGTYSNPDNWETLNNYTALAGVYTATKGTPGSPGASYLMLTSKTVSTSVVNGVAVYGKLDAVSMQGVAGLPFSQQPVRLTGNWQHMIYGSSQGSILVKLTKWNTITNLRDVVATGSVTLSGMAMSWATFTVNLTYASSVAPDSCMIVLKASGTTPTNNDYLWVDNLAFSGSVTGIKTIENNISDVSVFPNPATENVTVELNVKKASPINFKLVDLTGKLIKEINADEVFGNYKTSISITDIAKGSYFLKISTDDGVEVKKIMIQ
jgi:hypothetical protein